MPKCKFCDRDFIKRCRINEKFCSRECNVNYHATKNRQTRHCIVCGKELPLKKRKYCSNACSLKMNSKKQMEENREQYKKPKAEEKPKVIKKKVLSLDEVETLAREAGLSYGKYGAKHGLY